MKSKPKSTAAQLTKVLRQVSRDRYVAELRAGRRQRAITVPSGKAYRRRAKHVGRVEADGS